MRFLTLAAALLLITACQRREEAQLVAAPLPTTSNAWIELTPEPIEIGGGLVSPACAETPVSDPNAATLPESAPAAPPFTFWARRGGADALVIYFEGGGACWDDLTCSVPISENESEGFYKSQITPSDAPTRAGGIFDLANPRNPVRDWSFVYVPYCTGDLHAGSNTATYTDADSGESFTIQHRGADNFALILAWMRANFANPQQILVTGSSAGAYGAAVHYADIREAFPQGRAVMLGDSAQGVATREFIEARNANWHYALPKAVFGDDPARIADDDMITTLAAYFPNDRFAQYTTAQDLTQSAFYALMGAPNACRAWTQKMTSDLSQREQAPNFRAYLAAGQSHTILRSGLLYTQQSGGAPFLDWFGAALNADNAAWRNAACENCTTVTRRCPF